MKRLFVLMMIVLLLVGAAACGRTSVYYVNPPTPQPQQAEAPAAQPPEVKPTEAPISPDLLPQDVDPAVFVGTYKGYYENNSGDMLLTVYIYDAQVFEGEVVMAGEFEFEPGAGNTEGKSGLYRIEGTLDPVTGYVYMSGVSWRGSQPSGYEMLDFYGYMYENGYFAGDFVRDYKTFFEMIKVSDIA